MVPCTSMYGIIWSRGFPDPCMESYGIIRIICFHAWIRETSWSFFGMLDARCVPTTFSRHSRAHGYSIYSMSIYSNVLLFEMQRRISLRLSRCVSHMRSLDVKWIRSIQNLIDTISKHCVTFPFYLYKVYNPFMDYHVLIHEWISSTVRCILLILYRLWYDVYIHEWIFLDL